MTVGYLLDLLIINEVRKVKIAHRMLKEVEEDLDRQNGHLLREIGKYLTEISTGSRPGTFAKHKDYDKNIAAKLIKEYAPVILELKKYHNRPRPYDLDSSLKAVKMKSMNTPSYPSGHATQGCLMGMIFASKYPEYRKEFMELGKDVGDSRIIAKAHYPSDQRYGIKLAETLFDNLK